MRGRPGLRAQGEAVREAHGGSGHLGEAFAVADAPYYVVVGEKTAFPAVERRSLAHMLQNMWPKAASLGLGFHLVSLTAYLDGNEEFCGLLGVAPGECVFDGCGIGYATEWPSPTHRPALEEAVR